MIQFHDFSTRTALNDLCAAIAATTLGDPWQIQHATAGILARLVAHRGIDAGREGN